MTIFRFRYLLKYTTWIWSKEEGCKVPVNRKFSVPFLWLARLILWLRRDAWFKGGIIIDSDTRKPLYRIYLAVHMFGDGRPHLISAKKHPDLFVRKKYPRRT